MDSILNSIKKLLGIPESITDFDADIIMHINTAFVSLNILGVGPAETFSIESSTETWTNFSAEVPKSVRTYIYLTVRLAFDPPPTSFALESIDRQIQKLEYQMNLLMDEGATYE